MINAAQFIVYVQDQAASAAFYAQVLGIAPRLDVPGMTEFDLGAGALLGLMPLAGITRLLDVPVRSAPYRAEIYLLVDDPAAYHKRALQAGARELSPLAARDWGHMAAYSLDPDGYVIVFASVIEVGENP